MLPTSPPRVTHINSVIHIPPPPFSAFLYQMLYLLQLLSFTAHRSHKKKALDLMWFFFWTPPTSEKTAAPNTSWCLYAHCIDNDFYFGKNWFSSAITNVLCCDINTPSHFHLPHLMLAKIGFCCQMVQLMISFLFFIEMSNPSVFFFVVEKEITGLLPNNFTLVFVDETECHAR